MKTNLKVSFTIFKRFSSIELVAMLRLRSWSLAMAYRLYVPVSFSSFALCFHISFCPSVSSFHIAPSMSLCSVRSPSYRVWYLKMFEMYTYSLVKYKYKIKELKPSSKGSLKCQNFYIHDFWISKICKEKTFPKFIIIYYPKDILFKVRGLSVLLYFLVYSSKVD